MHCLLHLLCVYSLTNKDYTFVTCTASVLVSTNSSCASIAFARTEPKGEKTGIPVKSKSNSPREVDVAETVVCPPPFYSVSGGSLCLLPIGNVSNPSPHRASSLSDCRTPSAIGSVALRVPSSPLVPRPTPTPSAPVPVPLTVVAVALGGVD
jgi:hypothetical protein